MSEKDNLLRHIKNLLEMVADDSATIELQTAQLEQYAKMLDDERATVAQLRESIVQLRAQVKERDAEIATLNERLIRGFRMTRKRARGNARKIIVLVGDIQDLIGEAQGAYLNDRAPDRAAKVLNALETAFGKCLEITGMYEPVEVTHD